MKLNFSRPALVTILLVSLSLWCKSQQTEVTLVRSYTGKIDQYPIFMTLNRMSGKDSLTGSYYYVKNGKDQQIFLKGLLKNNTLSLTESIVVSDKGTSSWKNTGRLLLKMDQKWDFKGSWRNPESTKTMNVSLQCLEDPAKNDPSFNQYKASVYKVKNTDLSKGEREMQKIKALDIFDDQGHLIQKLDGFDEFIFENKVSVELEDLNFDGYLDLKILKSFPDRIKYDYGFVYYLYDPLKKKYVRNKELEALESLSFDAAEKQILKYLADGSGNETVRYYKWYGNSPLLFKEVRNSENDPYTHYTEYQVIKGKSVRSGTYKRQ